MTQSEGFQDGRSSQTNRRSGKVLENVREMSGGWGGVEEKSPSALRLALSLQLSSHEHVILLMKRNFC